MKFLQNQFLLVGVVVAALASSGCVSPKGETAQAKVAYAQNKRVEILEAFYKRDPGLRKDVSEAAGYMAFSIFGVHPGLISFANGYGVLTNNTTKKDTHSRWFRLTVGPGIAVKGVYALVLIDDPQKMAALEKGRWVAGSQLEAALKFGDFGGGLEWAALYGSGAKVHYFTHTGVALEIELIGVGKVSPQAELNKAASP